MSFFKEFAGKLKPNEAVWHSKYIELDKKYMSLLQDADTYKSNTINEGDAIKSLTPITSQEELDNYITALKGKRYSKAMVTIALDDTYSYTSIVELLGLMKIKNKGKMK
jgi:biopolymer transport protein ExbD